MEPVSGKLQGKRAAGQLGEDIACRYLEQQGQTVLARNWRSGHLEIDIVTSDREGNLRFVEVKTRVEPVAIAPEEQVNATKQRRLAGKAPEGKGGKGQSHGQRGQHGRAAEPKHEQRQQQAKQAGRR